MGNNQTKSKGLAVVVIFSHKQIHLYWTLVGSDRERCVCITLNADIYNVHIALFISIDLRL
jgi:hypothetical protein